MPAPLEPGLYECLLGTWLEERLAVTPMDPGARQESALDTAVAADRLALHFAGVMESGDFVPFERAEFERHRMVPEGGTLALIPATELRLEPFQERLLEQIAIARAAGRTPPTARPRTPLAPERSRAHRHLRRVVGARRSSAPG